VASYSAGRDIPAESEPSTGTKFDIAATDQIRPIATTTPIIHASICIPSRRVELADSGSHIFRRPNVRQFTDAQNFSSTYQCPALPLARPTARFCAGGGKRAQRRGLQRYWTDFGPVDAAEL